MKSQPSESIEQNTDQHQFESYIDYLASLRLNYVIIPADILQKTALADDKNLFAQRYLIAINGGEPWQAGTVALGNGNAYITVKTAILKKMKLAQGDPVSVNISRDNSEFGMTVSEELREVLKQDPEGEQRFLALPMGKQRYIIYYVNQVKSSQKRIERAWMLITNLKKCPTGKEEFSAILGKK